MLFAISRYFFSFTIVIADITREIVVKLYVVLFNDKFFQVEIIFVGQLLRILAVVRAY